jgi:CRP/FNR family transcriptional regulator, dissimilatory nitrate respiration regulator
MSLSDNFNLLLNIPYFSEIAEKDLLRIANTAKKKVFDSDQAIFLEGDENSGLFIVEDGWVKIVKLSFAGREQVLDFFGPGEAINALSLFASIPNPATGIALEKSTLWIIQQDIVLEMLETYPKIARAIIKSFAKRVQHLVALVEDLSLRSVEARLARILLAQATENKVHRKQWATQTEIAARIGTVTDVLSRAFRKLSEEGLITVSRHQIQILNSVELENRANGE